MGFTNNHNLYNRNDKGDTSKAIQPSLLCELASTSRCTSLLSV